MKTEPINITAIHQTQPSILKHITHAQQSNNPTHKPREISKGWCIEYTTDNIENPNADIAILEYPNNADNPQRSLDPVYTLHYKNKTYKCTRNFFWGDKSYLIIHNTISSPETK